MKKIFLIILILPFQQLCAQDTIHLKNQNTNEIVTDRVPQAVYFNIGGSGPIFSFNYDARFAKKLNGFGYTAGIGFYGETGASIFSIPFSINYLAGNKDNFFEFAAGFTFISEHSSDYSSISFDDGNDFNSSGVIEHISAGYRYQHAGGGFIGRIGICPLFYEGAYETSFYLGAGYTF